MCCPLGQDSCPPQDIVIFDALFKACALFHILDHPFRMDKVECNDHHQFETGIGPGYYSSDLEGGQEVLERIILFKERYPKVKLVYGHDLKTH